MDVERSSPPPSNPETSGVTSCAICRRTVALLAARQLLFPAAIDPQAKGVRRLRERQVDHFELVLIADRVVLKEDVIMRFRAGHAPS